MEEKRVVILTGASSGIGLALAERAARGGFDVIAVGRRTERLERLRYDVEGAIGHILPIALDITLPGAPATIARAALERYGRIDILVNNAGGVASGGIAEQRDDALREQVETHVVAPLALLRECLPFLKERGGHVFFVGSGVARIPVSALGAYPAAKAAVRNLTRIVRSDLRAHGIAVTYVDPGAVATEFMTRAGFEGPPALLAASPYAVARRIYRAFATRPSTVNGVPWQTSLVALGESVPSVTDWLLARAPGIVGGKADVPPPLPTMDDAFVAPLASLPAPIPPPEPEAPEAGISAPAAETHDTNLLTIRRGGDADALPATSVEPGAETALTAALAAAPPLEAVTPPQPEPKAAPPLESVAASLPPEPIAASLPEASAAIALEPSTAPPLELSAAPPLELSAAPPLEALAPPPSQADAAPPLEPVAHVQKFAVHPDEVAPSELPTHGEGEAPGFVNPLARPESTHPAADAALQDEDAISVASAPVPHPAESTDERGAAAGAASEISDPSEATFEPVEAPHDEIRWFERETSDVTVEPDAVNSPTAEVAAPEAAAGALAPPQEHRAAPPEVHATEVAAEPRMEPPAPPVSERIEESPPPRPSFAARLSRLFGRSEPAYPYAQTEATPETDALASPFTAPAPLVEAAPSEPLPHAPAPLSSEAPADPADVWQRPSTTESLRTDPSPWSTRASPWLPPSVTHAGTSFAPTPEILDGESLAGSAAGATEPVWTKPVVPAAPEHTPAIDVDEPASDRLPHPHDEPLPLMPEIAVESPAEGHTHDGADDHDDYTVEPASEESTEYERALSGVARRMKKLNLSHHFLARLLVPGDVLFTGDVALRWAGMPNKNERSLTAEALLALADAGYVERLEGERYRVLRTARE